MALIDMLWCFLLALRRHPGGIGLAGNATRPELLALNVVLGKIRLNAIRLSFSVHRQFQFDRCIPPFSTLTCRVAFQQKQEWDPVLDPQQ